MNLNYLTFWLEDYKSAPNYNKDLLIYNGPILR